MIIRVAAEVSAQTQKDGVLGVSRGPSLEEQLEIYALLNISYLTTPA